MNVPANQATQLPAHLAALQTNTALMGVNAAASGGISAGGHPRISIKGGRFRLQSPQGEEVVVNALNLDVILVDANPYGLSKIYYAGSYDPTVEDKAPDCYSDNGVGPSSRATSPQCGTCEACPMNVWGSKVNPSGSSTKACADVKKLAVLIADNPEGPVFELRIPPASLKNFGLYVTSLDSRGIPAAAVVTRMKMDTDADFPKLVFEAAGWVSEAQAQSVMEVAGSDEAGVCIGKNDKPIDAARLALAAPKAAVPALPPVAQTAPPPPAALQLPPALPAAPAAPAMTQAAAPVAEPAKRTRKPRSEAPVLAAAPPPVATQQPMATPAFLQNMPQNAVNAQVPLAPATPAFLQNMPAASPLAAMPQNAVNAQVPLAPATTNAQLDAMLAAAMSK